MLTIIAAISAFPTLYVRKGKKPHLVIPVIRRVKMRLILWAFVFTLLLLINAYAENVEDPYKNIQYFKLDNGLQIYLLSDNKAVNTQISAKVNVGSDVEDNKTSGLSHLVEHIVFRDQRIPHRDYVDYLKDEGATYVNGYTKRYETEYFATINSSKSYWAVEKFAQMMFDKKVSIEDLKAEKGAIQTELGEERWYEKYLWYLQVLSEKFYPPKDSLYSESFALDKPKRLPPTYKAKQNYRTVSLENVMQHYNAYYYPANMILKVVGDFDVKQMKSLIEVYYGSINTSGNAVAKLPPENPKLNNKPYFRFIEGYSSNQGYIGTKYILDNYKKYIILDAYMSNLAKRLQQQLRNELGTTYSINPYHFGIRKAMVATISFDGLRNEFENNIKIVNETIQKDLERLNDEIILDALKNYQKTYTSVEHDSDSLMDLIETAQYLREHHDISDKTSFEIFRSITHDEFRDVIKNTFKSENSYSYLYRDYYFFPLEMALLSIITTILLLFAYYKINLVDRLTKAISYTKRDVLMNRRLTNRFFGFLVFIFVSIITFWSCSWMKYLGGKYIIGDAFYLHTIDVPYSYIATIEDPLFSIIVFLVIYRFLFSYYARMDVIENEIYLVGNKIQIIHKDCIQNLEIETWSIKKFKNILGYSMLFWKPLLKIQTYQNQLYYLRTGNAKHLEEDLQKWLN
jgi:zinc protease